MAYLVPLYAIYIIIAGTGLFLFGFILQIYLYRTMSKYRVKTSLGIDFLFPEIDNWLVAVDFIDMPEEPIPTEAELNELEIQELVVTIRDRKRKRNEAANQLAVGGPKIIHYILPLFKEEHPETRAKVAAILRHLGKRATEAIPTLIDHIDDSDPQVQGQVICALARIGPQAIDALPKLVAQLSSDNPDVRTCSVIAIGRINQDTKLASGLLKKVIRLLDDPILGVRTATIIALEDLHEKQPNAIELLHNGLHDTNAILALQATEKLGQYGKNAEKAIPDLIEALKSQHPIIQIKIAHALYRIGYDPLALLRPVLTAARGGEIYVKLEALEILEAMGGSAEPAAQAYVRMLGDKNTLTRVAAVRGIAFLGEKARPLAPQLRRALEDPAKAVRHHAEKTLKALKEPLEEPELVTEDTG
ncbi:MAG: HEAT repeat domain-containing protein [Candidatus Thorarchaeota archaeon]